MNGSNTITQFENSPIVSSVNDNEYWLGDTQPWGQYARTPTHNGTMPAHGPNGGPGEGSVDDVTVYGTIDSPVVNGLALKMEPTHMAQSLLIFLKASQHRIQL